MIGSRFIMPLFKEYVWSAYHNQYPMRSSLSSRVGSVGWSYGRYIKSRHSRNTLVVI